MNTNHTDSVELQKVIELLRGIGSGVFNRDPLTHADNVIEEAVEIRDKAITALTTLQATQSQQVEEAVRKERERCIKVVEDYGKSMSELHNDMIANAHEDSKMMLAYDMHSRLIAVRHITNKLTPNHQD